MLCTFVLFYYDPSSFDYFRYSFYISALAMNHYFFHIIILTTSTVLMVILLPTSFAPLPPLALMLVYTIIYRPYKDRRDNIRSFFNLLVMCSLCGFRVLLFYTPAKQLASNIVIIYFSVNFLVLLPCVVIIGIIATIYSHVQYLRLMRQEDNLKRLNSGNEA